MALSRISDLTVGTVPMVGNSLFEISVPNVAAPSGFDSRKFTYANLLTNIPIVTSVGTTIPSDASLSFLSNNLFLNNGSVGFNAYYGTTAPVGWKRFNTYPVGIFTLGTDGNLYYTTGTAGAVGSAVNPGIVLTVTSTGNVVLAGTLQTPRVYNRSSSYTDIEVSGDSGATYAYLGHQAGNAYLGTNTGANLTMQTTQALFFNTGSTPTQRMWIDATGLTTVGGLLQGLGAGQSTPSVNTALNSGSTLLLSDTGAAVGNSGMILFAANSGIWRFASIKGYATDGGGNSQGDIVFSTRRVATDATLTESARIASNGDLSVAGNLYISGGNSLLLNNVVLAVNDAVNAGYNKLYDNTATPSLLLGGSPGQTYNVYKQDGHAFQSRAGVLQARFDLSGCAKPGGGTWLDSSDVRLKKDIKDYTSGLDQILGLRPVQYKFNGLAGTPVDDRVFTGLVADEVRDIMPEMVGTMQARLHDDDEDEVDLLSLDTTPLIFALVNAVRTLEERLRVIESLKEQHA